MKHMGFYFSMAFSVWILICFFHTTGCVYRWFREPFKEKKRWTPAVVPKGEPFVTVAGEYLRDSERLRHTQILGATGTGKTVLMEQLIQQDIARGSGLFIIDPKGDRELFERVESFCRKHGREGDLRLISANPERTTTRWNPCRLGSPSEIQSKFLNSWEFSEPYYAKACEAYLLDALNSLGDAPFSLLELTRELETIALRNKEDAAKALLLDLQSTMQGEWGRTLCCDPAASGPELNLLEVVRKNEIVFVDLPTEGKSVQSTRIGKMLLQELILISGYRKTHPNLRTGKPFSVYIDEFDAFATPSFATFLNKGRSSDFMIHIAHQTLSDLKRIDKGEGWFLGQILGNINNRFCFRMDDPEDADALAATFGTELTEFKTEKLDTWGMKTGEGSVREVYEFRIHPNMLKELRVGECIFHSKTGERLSKVRIPFKAPAAANPLPLLRGELQPPAEPMLNRTLDRVDLKYGNLSDRKRLRKTKQIET